MVRHLDACFSRAPFPVDDISRDYWLILQTWHISRTDMKCIITAYWRNFLVANQQPKQKTKAKPNTKYFILSLFTWLMTVMSWVNILKGGIDFTQSWPLFPSLEMYCEGLNKSLAWPLSWPRPNFHQVSTVALQSRGAKRNQRNISTPKVVPRPYYKELLPMHIPGIHE